MLIEQDGSRTELDDDAFNAGHCDCEQCGKAVCIRNYDGTSDCVSCSNESGDTVHDSDGVPLGFVHDDCWAQYIQECMAIDIENALKVRLPLGLELWAHERAANLAVILFAEYAVDMKKGKRLGR